MMLMTAGIMWKMLFVHAKLKYEAVKHIYVGYVNITKQFTFSQYS